MKENEITINDKMVKNELKDIKNMVKKEKHLQWKFEKQVEINGNSMKYSIYEDFKYNKDPVDADVFSQKKGGAN